MMLSKYWNGAAFSQSLNTNAQHDRLVERVEDLWTSENERSGLLQIEGDVRIPLTVYHFKIGGVLPHDVMEGNLLLSTEGSPCGSR